ncbi:hypothetical protein Taro_048297 [Colocasia esculenta]|uniref:Uncharacterized protein n=1 Tax=Colocasia esculenta TaxID=4460 RepID=A0A843X6C7_COLES|nr:hypothetical protein [Colocasia esculenta]
MAVIAWLCLVSVGVVGPASYGPVLLVVSASVFSQFRGPVLGCQSVVAPAYVVSRPRGVFEIRSGSTCGPSTLWRSEVVVFEVRHRSHLVVPWSRQVCRGLLPLCARLRLFRVRFCCCGAASGFEVCYWFGWCVLLGFPRTVPWWFWWRFSQDRLAFLLLAIVFSLMVHVGWSFGLCVLVKVPPRIALCRLWQRFFPGVLCARFRPPLCCPCGTKCVVWLSCILVRFYQDDSWRFWWRFSPKLPCVCFGHRCSLSP